MAEILGLNKVLDALHRLKKKYEGPAVIVGYTAAYAVHVHENLEMRHKEGKQAKFLEQPARELAKEIGQIVRKAVQGGATLTKALLIGGLRLQRESQKIVPVDTGALKGSAFTKEDK